MKKTNDELARDLRFRLVREVAAPRAKANSFAKSFEDLRTERSNLEKAKSAFSDSIVAEFKSCFENNELQEKSGEVQARYSEYMAEYARQSSASELKHKNLADEIKTLERRAWESLVKITNEVVSGLHGRGVLQAHYNTTEIMRVIGAIEELDESLVHWCVFLQSSIQVSVNEVKKVLETCEQGHPALFHVSTKVMPLDEEEIKSFCRGVDDYWFLKKNIPENSIPWKLGYVYRIDKKNDGKEKPLIYLVVTGDREAVLMNLQIGTYPYRTLTVIGKISLKDREKIDKIVEYLNDWQKKEKLPMTMEEVPEMITDASDSMIAYAILMHHAFDNFPGVIVKTPQLDMT